MGYPAARLTDSHACPKVEPGPVAHVGGPILTGMPRVLIGFLPAARVSDKLICVGPPDAITTGSPTVLTGYQRQARLGSDTEHGGVIVAGCESVLVGDSGGGAAMDGPSSFGGGGGRKGTGPVSGRKGSGGGKAATDSGGGSGSKSEAGPGETDLADTDNPSNPAEKDPSTPGAEQYDAGPGSSTGNANIGPATGPGAGLQQENSPDPEPAPGQPEPIPPPEQLEPIGPEPEDPASKLGGGDPSKGGAGLEHGNGEDEPPKDLSKDLGGGDDPDKGAGLQEVKPAPVDNGPGPYDTKDEAAKAALDKANPTSIDENREAGGQIYKDADGKYYYSGPVKGDGDHCCPSDAPLPDGAEAVGNYHTHGDYAEKNPETGKPQRTFQPNDDYDSDNFSTVDKENADARNETKPGWTSYLGTPSGKSRKYDPSTGQDTVLK